MRGFQYFHPPVACVLTGNHVEREYFLYHIHIMRKPAISLVLFFIE